VDNHCLLVGRAENKIALLDIDKDVTAPFATAYQALVLPDKRVLLQTHGYGNEWHLVDLSPAKCRLGVLGGGSLIGTPSPADLAKGVQPPMHRRVTVSPDGRWLLVEVTHVVGTIVGFAAPAARVYLRRIDDDRCWLLGGEGVAKRTDPGWAHWVKISEDIASKLGLPGRQRRTQHKAVSVRR